MPRPELVDEIANELETWPGVSVERRSPSVAIVSYASVELGVLDGDHGVVELRFSPQERDELVEEGDAEPATPVFGGELVSHRVQGPSDVTAALELFDRRYRDLRGADEPYSSQDPS